jgi:hypothetical protein
MPALFDSQENEVHMWKTMRHVVGVLAICAAAVFAQSERGSIRGTIQDSTGAVIPGAKVVATNVGTGVQTPTVSTEAGNYNIPQLPPGTYTVSVEKEGFRKLVRENVVVSVSAIVGLDLKLDVGAVSESVTVAAMAPQLKSESSEVSIAVSPKSFSDLPLNAGGGRAAENFLFLSPGTSGNTFDAHINGSQTLSKEMQIDGMSTVISEIQGDPRTLTFPPDALQEMSVMTSNYPAEFGNTGGGVERFVVKSGTNELHGNFYEFIKNDKLDARGFFNASRSIHRENEFGYSIGGPVYIPKVYSGKNKTFFFNNINWYKNRGGPQNSVASVPNDAMRGGDLSGWRNPDGSLIPVYDPASTRPDGQGGYIRDPFAGNLIPQGRMSQVSKNILTYVPRSATQAVQNNYPATGNTRNDNYNYTIKIDHYITQSHRVSGTWNAGYNKDNGPYAALPHPVQSSRDGNMFQKTARASYDWTISPTLLNSFRAGFNRQHQLLVAPETEINYSEKVGIKGTNPGFPVISWAPFTALAQNQDRIEPISNTFMYADSISWTKGKHNLKFGVDFRKLQHQGIYPSRPPSYNFSRNETAFPSAALRSTTGMAYASFLLGQVDSSGMYVNDVVAGARWTYAAGYAQDDFKLTPRITVNLGLRWDFYTPMTEVADRMSIMDPSKPNPKAGGLLGAYVFAGKYGTGTRTLTTLSGVYKKALGPRIGVAWKVNERVVVRTAYGVSYNPNGGLGGGNVTTATAGFSGTASFASTDQGLNPAYIWDNGFPQNFDRPPFIDPGLNINSGASMWGDKAIIPMTRQDWNFGTQWQLHSGLLLDVAYVGAKSTRLNTGAYNINQVDPRYLSLGDLLLKDINDPAVVAAGFKKPWSGFVGTLNQALRPYPQYRGIGMQNSANVGNMTYNSLQVKLERQFSKGLFLLTSYTWGKTITDASSTMGSFFSPGARDHYNRSLEKALSVFDVPQRLVAAFNYELPIGPGKPFLNFRGFPGKIFQGWQINGIFSYQTSVPIQIGAPNTLPLFNSFNTPDAVLGQAPVFNDKKGSFDPARDVLMNINAFKIPQPGKFGTSAFVLPNARSFPEFNENLGIMKRTYIKETMNVEFRFEMYNAFNRVLFGGPSTDLGNPTNFGKVTSQANGPRNTQFALKFNY